MESLRVRITVKSYSITYQAIYHAFGTVIEEVLLQLGKVYVHSDPTLTAHLAF